MTRKHAETGVLQVGDDLPGVFLRTLDAHGFALIIEHVLAGTPGALEQLHDFKQLLVSCQTTNPAPQYAQLCEPPPEQHPKILLTAFEANLLKEWGCVLICRPLPPSTPVPPAPRDVLYWVQEPFYVNPDGTVAAYEATGGGFQWVLPNHTYQNGSCMRREQTRFPNVVIRAYNTGQLHSLPEMVMTQIRNPSNLLRYVPPAHSPGEHFRQQWEREHTLPGERWEDDPMVSLTVLDVL